MNRAFPTLLLAALALPALADAQEAPDRRFDAARYVPQRVISDLPAAPVEWAAPAARGGDDDAKAEAGQARDGRSFLSTVLHTVGGALVGGWVGYVGSQVTLSDWEKETNSSFNAERGAWVAGGMVVGILGSRLLGSTSAPGMPALEPRRAGRNFLTREEIATSGATNVYELVSSARKGWLVPRGVNSIKETARGSGVGFGPEASMQVQPGQAAIVVYMDDIRIGEVERMREIMINDIMEIEFVEPQVAAYRYGSGHSHGVIVLRTSL